MIPYLKPIIEVSTTWWRVRVEWKVVGVFIEESNGSVDSSIMVALITYCSCGPFEKDAEVDIGVLMPSQLMI